MSDSNVLGRSVKAVQAQAEQRRRAGRRERGRDRDLEDEVPAMSAVLARRTRGAAIRTGTDLVEACVAVESPLNRCAERSGDLHRPTVTPHAVDSAVPARVTALPPSAVPREEGLHLLAGHRTEADPAGRRRAEVALPPLHRRRGSARPLRALRRPAARPVGVDPRRGRGGHDRCGDRSPEARVPPADEGGARRRRTDRARRRGSGPGCLRGAWPGSGDQRRLLRGASGAAVLVARPEHVPARRRRPGRLPRPGAGASWHRGPASPRNARGAPPGRIPAGPLGIRTDQLQPLVEPQPSQT